MIVWNYNYVRRRDLVRSDLSNGMHRADVSMESKKCLEKFFYFFGRARDHGALIAHDDRPLKKHRMLGNHSQPVPARAFALIQFEFLKDRFFFPKDIFRFETRLLEDRVQRRDGGRVL